MSEAEYGRWCIEETARIIEREGPDTIAAMFVEPVQGSGGVIVPPPGYLKALRDLCRKHSILFVSDEFITGYGRTGAWFASELWDLDPDMMNTAKALTSRYLPLSALFVSDEISKVVIDGGMFSHIFTYSGHPAATAAALANLAIMESENLIPRTRDTTGPYFQARLKGLASHRAVGEVRGVGLIGALEMIPKGGKLPVGSPPAFGPKALSMFRKEGLIVRVLGDTVAICPPLIVTESEIDIIFDTTRRVLDRLWD
jgi:adenosylmethionine-8-amino-7-oxononanoate aminotransferase